METKLGEFEHKHLIRQRWKPTDKEYIEARCSHYQERQQVLHTSLRASIVKRQFLLKLKAKYAGKFLTLVLLLK